jgi:PEP-CTERM motif
MNGRPIRLAIALLGMSLLGRPALADLLIANVGSNSILRYDESANTLTTFTSGDNGALNVPHGMIYGPDGNLYVSSLGTGSILEYNGTTGVFMGTFVPHTVGQQTLQYPNGIAFDPNNSQNLYIASYYDNAIERYNTATRTLTVYATLPSNSLTAAHLEGPTGLVFGSDGKLYVNESTRSDGSQIRQYDVSNGDTVGRSIVGGASDSITHLNAPAQLTFGPSNGSNPPLLIDTGFYQNSVNSYQLSYQNGQIVGTWLSQLAGVSPGGLNEPGGVAYDPTTGRVVITNYVGNSLVSANLNGTSDVSTVDVSTLNPTSVGGAALNEPTYIVAIPSASIGTPTPTPEPASLALFGIGALVYIGARLRHRRSA